MCIDLFQITTEPITVRLNTPGSVGVKYTRQD